VADPAVERYPTVPNVVTSVRTVIAVALGVWAATSGAWELVVAGYAVYWLGDILDGYLARRLHQETRIGAVADIGGDRLSTATVGIALMIILPWTILPVAVFLIQFLVVDLMLSLGFLRWPLLSPNYFYLVDPVLYRWNWWPPVKALNTTSVVLVTALTGSAAMGAAVAMVGLAVKLISLLRLRRLLLSQLC
jgi:phosphatidylglycerophosphate synthase